jgi:hypothetical protein
MVMEDKSLLFFIIFLLRFLPNLFYTQGEKKMGEEVINFNKAGCFRKPSYWGKEISVQFSSKTDILM